MALIVEDGTGLSTADSYISLADTESYMSILPDTTAWDALSDPDKEDYIKWATRTLDAKSTYNGTKVYETASLRWPRSGVKDKDGYLVADDIVPLPISDSTAELVRMLLTQADLTSENSVDYLKKVVADVVEVEYQNNTSQSKVTEYINAIMSPLGWFNTGGTGFGRIRKA